MGGVLDGQAVDAAITNPAFINKNGDDTMPNQLGFSRPLSGLSIADIQQAVNNLYTATGVTDAGGATVGTAYNATANTITNGDPYVTAFRKLANKFDALTGHHHTGAAGDGPNVAASGIGGVPLLAYTERQVSGLFAVTGSTYPAPTAFSFKSPSTGITVPGVPSVALLNQVYMRGASGQELIDSLGYTVYGRLTYPVTGAATGWQLSFFSAPGNVETAFSFGATPTNIDFFFQELFNPLLPTPPTYTFDLISKNQNYTLSVLTATTGTNGKVLIAGTAAQSVGSANTIGTTNGTVANADHAHQGLHSIAVTGQTALFGDAVLQPGANITLAQTGQNILVTASGGGGGGGSLEWIESGSSPLVTTENNNRVYAYAASGAQSLYALIKVPTSYVPGNPIKLKLDFYSPDSSGTALMQTVSTLIRQGTDVITSTTNQRTSTNSAVTLGAGTVSIPQGVSFDLSDSSGKINSVSISAGDYINIQLTRAGSDTGTSDLKVPVFGAEVTIQ